MPKVKAYLVTALLLLTSLTSQSKPSGYRTSDVETLHQSVPSFRTVHSLQATLAESAQSINPKVLELAVKAHSKARGMGLVKKSLLTIIDYSLPSTQRRMWVMDTAKGKVIYHTHVAHGSGSGDNMAKRFSDKPGSYQSSIGVFLTGSTYQGKHGNSLVLHGLEKGINGNAQSRRIVIHAADYVGDHMIKNQGRLGRSWGCPALNNKVAQPIIRSIKEGSMIFAYYPDKNWLNKSRFL